MAESALQDKLIEIQLRALPICDMDKKTGITLLIFQLCLILAFGCLADYGSGTEMPAMAYTMFQDVQVIAFIGVGLLMAYLKRFMYSSLGLVFLVCGLAAQYGLICSAMFSPLMIDNDKLFQAEVTGIVVLISMGACFGKVTPMQLILLVVIEAPVYLVVLQIQKRIQVADIGGGISVHLFAAYFGITVCKVLGCPTKENDFESSSYHSDFLSMIGAVFLWIYWPSFNAYSFVTPDGQQRAVFNTYLALLASCVTAFAMSSLAHKDKKFTMAHIQNASLAGGVAIGGSADLVLGPWVAVSVGMLAAIFSVLGFIVIQPWLKKRVHIHDTCGIHNLHGIPSLLGGILTTLASWRASLDIYGYKLYRYFPARTPSLISKLFLDIKKHDPEIDPGEGRSAEIQACYQILWMLLTLIIAVTSGTITGLLMRLSSKLTGSVPEERFYKDENLWVLPDEVVNNDNSKIESNEGNVNSSSQTLDINNHV